MHCRLKFKHGYYKTQIGGVKALFKPSIMKTKAMDYCSFEAHFGENSLPAKHGLL